MRMRAVALLAIAGAMAIPPTPAASQVRPDTVALRVGDTLKVPIRPGCVPSCTVDQRRGASNYLYRVVVRIDTSTPRLAIVPPIPPQSTDRVVRFSSDFAFLGTTMGAVSDGMRWNRSGGTALETGLEVIPSAGLDFPSANVLRHTAVANRAGMARIVVEGLGEIPVGGRRAYRVYVRAAMPDDVTDRWHPIEDSPPTRAFRLQSAGEGRWTLDFRVANANIWTLTTPLQKHVTYRVEWLITRLTATTMAYDARVYNTAEQLLHASAAFQGPGGTLATVRSIPFDSPASVGTFQAGSNGIDSPGRYPYVAMYQGAFAICDGDWCGPYVRGETGR